MIQLFTEADPLSIQASLEPMGNRILVIRLGRQELFYGSKAALGDWPHRSQRLATTNVLLALI